MVIILSEFALLVPFYYQCTSMGPLPWVSWSGSYCRLAAMAGRVVARDPSAAPHPLALSRSVRLPADMDCSFACCHRVRERMRQGS